MAQHYLFPQAITKRFPALTRFAWRIEAVCLVVLFQLLRCLPIGFSGRLCGWMVKNFGPHTTKFQTASRNLQLVYPDKNAHEIDQLSRQTFYSLGLAISELIHMPTVAKQQKDRLEFAVDPDSEKLICSKRAIVYIVAHTEAWQYTPFLASEYGFPTAIIYAPESNPYLDKLFMKLRQSFGVRLVSRDGGMRALSRELKEGNSIGLAIDSRLEGAEMIPLFGIDAPTNTAPARLALKNNCPVLPVHVERLPNFRYRINVGKQITADNPDAPATERAIAITRKINRVFEQWISDAPGQWICLKRRWPKTAYPPKNTIKNK